jgi:hypothetical protein
MKMKARLDRILTRLVLGIIYLTVGNPTTLSAGVVVLNGGGTASSENYTISCGIGEAFVGIASSESFTMTAGSVIGGPDPPSYVCGDADGSNVVNISDAVFLMAYIFGGGPAPVPPAAGDPNCDGSINISDAVALIAYIFGGGEAPCSNCNGKVVAGSNPGHVVITTTPVSHGDIEEQVFEVSLATTEEVGGLQFEFLVSDDTPVDLEKASDCEPFTMFSKREGNVLKVGMIDFSGHNALKKGQSTTLRFTLHAQLPAEELLTSAIVVNPKAEEMTVEIREGKSIAILPESYELKPNYPNPFNPTTMISYALPRSVKVNLTIYNVLGQQVRSLVSDYQPAGYYEVQWDGRNDQNEIVASGLYLYRLSTDEFSDTRKMMLLK